jgi:hypothetical protein
MFVSLVMLPPFWAKAAIQISFGIIDRSYKSETCIVEQLAVFSLLNFLR